MINQVGTHLESHKQVFGWTQLSVVSHALHWPPQCTMRIFNTKNQVAVFIKQVDWNS